MNNVCTSQNDFSFYCFKWLERQKIRCKQTTYAVYYSNVHNYIIPYFENMHIADIANSDRTECLFRRNGASIPF